MRGLLKTKRAGTQLVLIISVALVSFFIIGGLVGPVLMSAATGINLSDVANPAHWDFSKPIYANLMRGLQFVQFVSLFLIPCYIGARLFSSDSKKYLGFRKPWSPYYYLVGVALLLLALPLVEWLGRINQEIPLPASWTKWMQLKEDAANVEIKGLLTRHTLKDLILNIIFIAGLAAVGEELFFRGLLQRLFIKMFKNHWAGIIVAAFLFSAIHMQFYGFLPRFALGIVLGLVYWYSGSLWTAMLAHFIYDGSLIVLAYNSPGTLDGDSSVQVPNLALAAAISFAIVSLLTAWMIRHSGSGYHDVYADDAVPVKDNPF